MIRKSFILAVLLWTAGMAQTAGNSTPEVLVRVFNPGSIPLATLAEGEAIATKILGSAGVRLRWKDVRSSGKTAAAISNCRPGRIIETIDLRILDSTPQGHKPGALAAALPFALSGIRIVVFYDRVSSVVAADPQSAGRILGHVVGHEVGHVLLGIADHAEAGLMKAHWSIDDYSRMGAGNLAFTPEDALSIRSNLGRICAQVADTFVSAANNQ